MHGIKLEALPAETTVGCKQDNDVMNKQQVLACVIGSVISSYVVESESVVCISCLVIGLC